MPIRIVLADDHDVLRMGLRLLLDMQEDMQVVGEASDGLEMLERVREQQPDIVVMDIGMPNLDGIEATRRLKATLPHVKVLALSMLTEAKAIAGILQAGAAGYVLKSCDAEELARAIRTVVQDQVYISPGIADSILEGYLSHVAGTTLAGAAELSAREQEVLRFIAEGETTKQIAKRLGLSVRTVETHRRQIMERLDIHSVAELTKYAVREGLTSLDG